nr:hypothetical protein [Tanacetum cinerariifolium]
MAVLKFQFLLNGPESVFWASPKTRIPRMLSDNMDTYKSQCVYLKASTGRSASLKPLPHEMLKTEVRENTCTSNLTSMVVASLLPVFDIVLVVELLMLLMTSVVICVIANDVTVNLHCTEQYDRNVEERKEQERKKREENACFTTSRVSIGLKNSPSSLTA